MPSSQGLSTILRTNGVHQTRTCASGSPGQSGDKKAIGRPIVVHGLCSVALWPLGVPYTCGALHNHMTRNEHPNFGLHCFSLCGRLPPNIVTHFSLAASHRRIRVQLGLVAGHDRHCHRSCCHPRQTCFQPDCQQWPHLLEWVYKDQLQMVALQNQDAFLWFALVFFSSSLSSS